MRKIQIATTPRDRSLLCGMSQLRPMLIADEFAGRVQAQQAEGYQFASLEYGGRGLFAVRDFACRTMLSSGKTALCG